MHNSHRPLIRTTIELVRLLFALFSSHFLQGFSFMLLLPTLFSSQGGFGELERLVQTRVHDTADLQTFVHITLSHIKTSCERDRRAAALLGYCLVIRLSRTRPWASSQHRQAANARTTREFSQTRTIATSLIFCVFLICPPLPPHFFLLGISPSYSLLHTSNRQPPS